MEQDELSVAAARHLRIESIRQRTRGLTAALRSWRHLPTVADFLDDASSWLATKWYGSAAPERFNFPVPDIPVINTLSAWQGFAQ